MENGYYLVFKWMTSELNLKGCEKDVFAVIWNFSHKQHTKYTGTIRYLIELTGWSRRSIMDALELLVQKKYIAKYKNDNTKYISYKALIHIENDEEDMVAQNDTDGADFAQDGIDFAHIDIKDNNIIKDNTTNSKDTITTIIPCKEQVLEKQSHKQDTSSSEDDSLFTHMVMSSKKNTRKNSEDIKNEAIKNGQKKSISKVIQNQELLDRIFRWIEMLYEKKGGITNVQLSDNIERLIKDTNNNPQKMIEIVNYSISSGYRKLYTTPNVNMPKQNRPQNIYSGRVIDKEQEAREREELKDYLKNYNGPKF